jgi:phosphofurin acidic cluster sorting protein 2
MLQLQVLESVQDLGDRSDNQYVDDLFDEVENLSDSDIDMDTMSVHSTPKPKLT